MNSYQFGQLIGTYHSASKAANVVSGVYTASGFVEAAGLTAGIVSVSPVLPYIYGAAAAVTTGKAIYDLFS